MSGRLIHQYSNGDKYIGGGIGGGRREEGGVTMLNTLVENYLVVQFSDSKITRPCPGPAGLQLWAWSSRCSCCLLLRRRSILAFKSLLDCSWLNGSNSLYGYNVSTENKDDMYSQGGIAIVFQIDNIKLI